MSPGKLTNVTDQLSPDFLKFIKDCLINSHENAGQYSYSLRSLCYVPRPCIEEAMQLFPPRLPHTGVEKTSSFTTNVVATWSGPKAQGFQRENERVRVQGFDAVDHVICFD